MIKEKEVEILNYFRQDGRDTLTNASKRTHIPVTTIYEVLRKHQGRSISKHTTLLNFKQLGYEGIVTIIVKLPLEFKESFRQYMLVNKNVNSLIRINNGYHFLFECIFKKYHEAEQFIAFLEDEFKVREKHVFYQLEEIQREKFLLN